MPRGIRKNSKKQAEENGSGDLPLLQLANQADERLDIPAMEQWLWDAACKIRGSTDAPKYKDFILPLIFYKRLSDVFDDEYEKCAEKFGGGDLARAFIEADHKDAIKNNRQPIVRYYVPHEYRWDAIRFHPKDGLGEFITTAMREVAKRNPGLSGTLTLKDYNEKQSNQRVLDNDPLKDLIEVISRHRLGLKNTNADVLGEAYEYLLRKFAEGQGLNSSVAIPGLNRNDAYAKVIYLPPLPEQKTIAHTLRIIQKAKETRQRELELERERKAALMQYLFTHGTRNEPREDKEIGKIPKSWIVSRFDSLCVLQRGFDITKKEQNPGKIPVISSGGISSYHNLAKVNGPGVIIGRKGTLGTVHYVDCDYWPHDTTLWVKEFNENNPLFIAYLLYFLNLKRFDSGASNPTLNRNTVHAMTIAYPKKEEQQEIAAILKACDRKIQALEKEIALIDELFHAMLEQLMTGKISTQPLTETYV